MKDLFAKFVVDYDKFIAGNKTAGKRARLTSLEIEKALKEFRKESVKM